MVEVGRLPGSFVLALLVALSGEVRAADVVINNGLECSNPGNVIGDETDPGDVVHVRNVGCPPGWPAAFPDDPCPAPGDATDVCVDTDEMWELHAYDSSTVTVNRAAPRWENRLRTHDSSVAQLNGGYTWDVEVSDSSTLLVDGGGMGDFTARDSSTVTFNEGGLFYYGHAGDSSVVTVNGGTLYGLGGNDSSLVTINGGNVFDFSLQGESVAAMRGGTAEIGFVQTGGSSSFTMTGGTLRGSFFESFRDDSVLAFEGGSVAGVWLVFDASHITFVGSDFEVDGSPVPYGELSAQMGLLGGTLALGGSVDILFFQGGFDDGRRVYSGTITLVPAADIDIKPGSDINVVNPRSQGVIPVAIFGSESFDVAGIDPSTLSFGPGETGPSHAVGGHPEDVNDDGFVDLVSHYPVQESGIALGDTEACVTGASLDGTPLAGCDEIRTVGGGACGLGFELALLLPPLIGLRRPRRLR